LFQLSFPATPSAYRGRLNLLRHDCHGEATQMDAPRIFSWSLAFLSHQSSGWSIWTDSIPTSKEINVVERKRKTPF
jgi:hypothetical protein